MYQEDDHQRLTTDPTSNYLHRDPVIQWGSIWVSSVQDGYWTHVPPRRRSSSSCPTDVFSGHGGATAPTTAGPGVQQQQQQSALGIPQTTGTRISIQQQLKMLPSALNVPQVRISSNGNLCPLATPVLTAPLASPQSCPTPTATNGQTSPVPSSFNESEESHSSSTPAPRDYATPSAEVTPARVTSEIKEHVSRFSARKSQRRSEPNPY